MTAKVLDGRALAAQIFEEVRAGVSARVDHGKSRPALATILIGNDPASELYVRSKQKNAKQVGIEAHDHRLPTSTTTDQLVELVTHLNEDDAISGVLIQQPAPSHIDMTRVIMVLDPVKDVDGFHPVNAGLVSLGWPEAVEPCTPAGRSVTDYVNFKIRNANNIRLAGRRTPQDRLYARKKL